MTNTEMQELVNRHEIFTGMLQELSKSLVKSSGVKFHVIESRTKTMSSILEKIDRKLISDVEKEITDISGIRIILYYQDDVDKITQIIRDNFKIDEKESINKADLFESNEFGYLSTHYIVSLDSKRNKLPEWKSSSKLKAEIQIRTVLQHSWASISHELTYKKNYDVPKELERRLFRLAGLFELADEQFLKIRDEHEILVQSIKKISNSNEIEDERINLLTLKFSFEKHDTIYDEVAKLAIASGFEGGVNSVQDNSLSDIILASQILNFKYVHEIESTLKKHVTKLKTFFDLLLPEPGESPWFGDKSFYNLLAIISTFDNTEILKFFNSNNTGWNKSVIDIVKKAHEDYQKTSS